MTKLPHKIKEEFLAAIPPTVYFFIALHLVAFIRVLMLKGTGIAATSSVSILVAALILGKSVLIADHLPIINRFPEHPLIYNIGWKTLIYLVISAVMHYLERLYDFSRGQAESLPATKSCSPKSCGPTTGQFRLFFSC